MNNQNRIESRVDRLIARASVCHMSNTKWRKLFAILKHPSIELYRVNWKFIDDERVFKDGIPEDRNLLNDRFGDIHPYPYVEYKTIDWLEIPKIFSNPLSNKKRPLPNINHDLINIQNFLESQSSQFPIQMVDSGLRIIGYTWNKLEY